MFKHTLVVLLVTLSSVTSTIAQGELLLPHTTDLSPKQVQLFDVSTPKEAKIVYKEWLTLDSHYERSVWDLWFQKGSCTDYASSKRPELFTHRGKRLITGNAKQWLSNAKALWIPTNTVPKQWSIAVYLPWDDGASSYGHVAYVESVGDNGVIVISDMNYQWNHIVTTRTVSANAAAWYID
jgi:surface antigen